MFVALGVGVFLGISWASPALQGAADGVFDEGAFHNFQIQYPYGLTDADLKKLSETEGVSQVEAERQSFQTLKKDNREHMVKVQSLGQSVDVPIIVEGELPAKRSEIALHAKTAEALGLAVGDTIKFEHDAQQGGDSAASLLGDEASDGASENESGMKYLLRDSFTITALVDSPEYIALSPETYGYSPSPSGEVDAMAWVVDDIFDAAAFQNGYPIVNVRSDGLAGMATFSDDYKQASGAIQDPIEALGATLAVERYDDLHGQAQKKIDDAQAQIDKAEADIAQAEKDIADGESRLESGRAELEQKKAEGQAKLDQAYATLMSGEAEKANGEQKLYEGYAKVNDGQARIDAADAAIAEAKAEVADAKAYKKQCDKELKAGEITQKQYNKRLDKRGAQADAKIQPLAEEYGEEVPNITHENYDDALLVADLALENSEDMPVTVEGEDMTLGEARERLASAKAELAAAQAEYDAKVAELNDGWNQYYAGQATLESEVAKGEQELADGQAQIDDAKQQVEEGKQKVADGKPKLESAKAELAKMVKYNWTVMPRAYNSGAVEISTFCDVTDNLSISMAALFIIVGLLVSYFAVSRIVHEQITQIGTKKALGFRQGEITSSFLWYSGIAVVVGAIVGALIAFLLVESIIGGTLGGMFIFGPYPSYFGWGLFILILAIELVLVLGATYLACRKILKEHAVELLRGEKPPAGKTRFYEKWGIWDKLPLLVQTIVNNCINDKRRVLSTIVGVAGCTALIVTAITLNNDVMKSYDRHYENVYGFDMVTYANSDPESAVTALSTALGKQGYPTAQVFKKSYLLKQPNGESGAMHVVVPVDEEEFAELYHMNSLEGGPLDLSAEGAWVTRAYADHLGAKVGDTVAIDGGDGTQHEVPILGFYEFWLTYHEMVMGKDYYEKEFGSFSPNVVLTQAGETEVAEVEKTVSGVDGFYSIIDDAKLQYGNFETFSSVSSAVVLIYLVLAVLMAIVVLLNLNVMFIEEKKRELIVLMINGYSTKDARHYISYDSIVLTILGIIVGLILGCIMGSITVASIEPSTGVFVKDADLWAILIGIAGSAVLAIIMGKIALRRIKKFKLTDINRF